MRFLMLVTAHNTTPPSPDLRARVMQRVEDDVAAGRLVAKGALGKSATAAARVTSKDGVVSTDETPTGESWMKAGGFSIIEAPSKEDAIAEAEKTLKAMGDGVVELIEVTPIYPAPIDRSRDYSRP